jgi:hypothetical protein
MLRDFLKNHLAEWVEVSSILVGMLVGAIALGSIALYRIDEMHATIQGIAKDVKGLPLLEHDLSSIKSDIIKLESRIYAIEIENARTHVREHVHDSYDANTK